MAEKTDRVADFRIFDQTEDVFVGGAGFLLGGHVFRQVRNRIAFTLEFAGVERDAARGLGPESQRVIHVVGTETGSFDLLRGQVAGKLVNDRRDDLKVRQLFGTCRSIGNVPEEVLRGQV